MKAIFKEFYKSNFNEINKTVKILIVIFSSIWFTVFSAMFLYILTCYIFDLDVNSTIKTLFESFIWPDITIAEILTMFLFFIHLFICEKLHLEM